MTSSLANKNPVLPEIFASTTPLQALEPLRGPGVQDSVQLLHLQEERWFFFFGLRAKSLQAS